MALADNVEVDAPPPETTAAAHAPLAAAAGGLPPLSLQEAGRLLTLEQRTSYGVMAVSAAEVCSWQISQRVVEPWQRCSC